MRRIALLLIGLAVLVLRASPLPTPSYAQAGCASSTGEAAPPAPALVPGGALHLELLSSLGGRVASVAVADDLIAHGEGGALTLEQIGQGRVGRLPLPDIPRDIALVHGQAYVAAGSAGIRVFTLEPFTQIAALQTPGLAAALRIVGTRAYVAAAGPDGGLLVLDIANPARPRLLGRVATTGAAQALDVAGTLVYVAQGLYGGVSIVDVTDPLAPMLRGSLLTPGAAYGIAVRGTRAYVAAGTCGLQIIDITNPAAPTLQGAVATDGEAHGVTVANDRAIVARGSRGIAVFDISGAFPKPPAARAPHPTPAFDITVAKGMLYSAAGDAIYSQPLTGGATTALTAPGVGGLLTLNWQGSTLYAGLSTGTVARISVATPQQPRLAGSIGVGGRVVGLARGRGALLAASGGAGIVVLDVAAAPSTPLTRTLALSGTARAVLTNPTRDRAFIAAGSAGVHVLDLSTALSPRRLRTIDTPGSALGLASVGDLLYIADSTGLQISRLSDGQVVGRYSAPAGSFIQGVQVADDRAYLADRSGLLVIDVSDPRTPRYSGATGGFSAYALELQTGRAYVAAGPSGIVILSLANPDRPEIIGWYDTPGSAQALALMGDQIAVADHDGGLLIVRQVALPYATLLPLLGR